MRLLELDFPDPDVIRVGDRYYMIGTTMHFFPGGEILQSDDLVHWEWAGSVFETLGDDPEYRLEDGRTLYGRGMWAASLRHHRGRFVVLFSTNENQSSWIFTADQVEGPWTKRRVEGFYHDPSLLFWNNRVLVAHGNTRIQLTELRPDLTGPLSGGFDRVVVEETGNRFLGYEGSHLHHIGGRFHLFLIHSRPDQWRRVQCWFTSETLEGPWTGGEVFDQDYGIPGGGAAQGGLVDTPDGRWFAVLFQDRGAVGRIPVLVPVHWEGHRPVLEAPEPPQAGPPAPPVGPPPASLTAEGPFRLPLTPPWQWNHQPDPEGWEVDRKQGSLILKTRRLAGSFSRAPNTLTRRLTFPGGSWDVSLDASELREGDFAGMAALCGGFVWLGYSRKGREGGLVLWSRPVGGQTAVGTDPEHPGTEVARVSVRGDHHRLRLTARFGPEGDSVRFWHRTPGEWRPVGEALPLRFTLDHFAGCRLGLFAFSTLRTGGQARFSRLTFGPAGS